MTDLTNDLTTESPNPVSHDEIYERVCEMILAVEVVKKPVELGPDTVLDDIALDSLEKLSLGMDLEEFYEIELSDEQIEELETITDVVSLILQILAKKTQDEPDDDAVLADEEASVRPV